MLHLSPSLLPFSPLVRRADPRLLHVPWAEGVVSSATLGTLTGRCSKQCLSTWELAMRELRVLSTVKSVGRNLRALKQHAPTCSDMCESALVRSEPPRSLGNSETPSPPRVWNRARSGFDRRTMRGSTCAACDVSTSARATCAHHAHWMPCLGACASTIHFLCKQ